MFLNIYIERERGREREKERQRERDRERERETARDRETERQRQRDRETDTQRDRHRHRQRETQTVMRGAQYIYHPTSHDKESLNRRRHCMLISLKTEVYVCSPNASNVSKAQFARLFIQIHPATGSLCKQNM